MILLADYNFYQNNYKGQLSSDLFEKFIPKASFEIEYNINRELVEADNQNMKIQFVACMLVDLLASNDTVLNDEMVSSYSIDGVSESYNKLSKDEFDKEKIKILDRLPIELRYYLY